MQHIDEHRRSAGAKMEHEGRMAMHEHLESVLTGLLSEEIQAATGGRLRPEVSTNLLARYVASTFVLVLNWWVDGEMALTPADVDARFRALVLPSLMELSGTSARDAGAMT